MWEKGRSESCVATVAKNGFHHVEHQMDSCVEGVVFDNPLIRVSVRIKPFIMLELETKQKIYFVSNPWPGNSFSFAAFYLCFLFSFENLRQNPQMNVIGEISRNEHSVKKIRECSFYCKLQFMAFYIIVWCGDESHVNPITMIIHWYTLKQVRISLAFESIRLFIVYFTVIWFCWSRVR